MADANAWLSQTWDRQTLRWDYYVNLFDVNNTAGPTTWCNTRTRRSRPIGRRIVDPISNWAIGPSDQVGFPITATDPDGDRLAFRLEAPVPAGAAVTPEGSFSWQPGAVPVPSTNRITVTVTDNGMPALSDSRGFTVLVRLASTNQAPVLALSTNLLVYAEESGPLAVDALARVTDEDTAVFDGGRLTVAVIEGRTDGKRFGLAAPSETQTNIIVTAENVVLYREVRSERSRRAIRIRTCWRWISTPTRAGSGAGGSTGGDVREHRGARVFARSRGPVRSERWRRGVSAPVDLAVAIVAVNHAPMAVNDEAATTADVPIALMISKLNGNDTDADGDL